MRSVLIVAALLLSTVAACQAQNESQNSPATFEVAFPNLTFERPIYFAVPPTDGNSVFVIVQRGLVYRFPNKRDVSESERQVVLDIQERVQSPQDDGHNEEGLLGMAFHPDFAENHKVYFDYSRKDDTPEPGDRRSIIAEWQYNPETGKIDPDSERVLMEIEQPFGNHNGGHLAFGPKGYLYITKGDGGSGGDPNENGQDLSTRLGSIMRIDVDHREHGKPYAIPDSNPFVNKENALPEIYAYGLRNAWRYSFDPVTKTMWAGDVGQVKYEEVDIIRKGGNYGWNEREGFHAYKGGQKSADMIDPVHEYPRDKGKSVTGGYLYRGENVPALQGAYIFGDYATGYIWAIRAEGNEMTSHRRIALVPAPASFGVDRQNELYICSFDKHIYKMKSSE